MKAKELMIGDWVIAQPDEDICGEGVGTIVDRVTEIYDVEGVLSVTLEDFDYPVAVGLLDPFPLTAEILEKNGFIGKEEGHYYSYHVRYGRLCNEIFELHYQNHWIACSTPDNRDEFALFGVIILRYVHELQHALRLCGIDKKIVL